MSLNKRLERLEKKVNYKAKGTVLLEKKDKDLYILYENTFNKTNTVYTNKEVQELRAEKSPIIFTLKGVSNESWNARN